MNGAKKGSILIVDDSRINFQLASTILNIQQYQTHTISQSKEVMDWVGDHLPDLILLDIMMPDLDGITLCRALKADPKTAAIPIVFLTAKAGTTDIVEGLKAGGADYLTKPFQQEELIARVATHIQLYQHQRELFEKKEALERSLAHITKLSNAMLTICAWTKQVQVDGQWISIDQYLSEYLGLSLTHGISNEGVDQLRNEIKEIDSLGS